jgi:signal transduction histidine kinase
MHDAISQTLTVIRMNLDAAQIEAANLPHIKTRLAECGELVDDVARQTRTLMFDLYPAMLDDLGLVPTLEWYAGQLALRSGVEVLMSDRGEPSRLPAAVTNYLFRAAKELMNNAVRHGQPSEISVSTHWEQHSLRLVVDDDGKGFDVAAVLSPRDRQGLGLHAMRDRLGSMGGRLHMESTTGQGSRVIIELPLHHDLPVDTDNEYASPPS